MINTYTTLHCHSEYSSALLRFPDAIGKVKDAVEWCYENGLRGYALTDHQGCSGYVDLEQAIDSLDIKRPFQHIFGNEFYLLSEEENELRFSSDQKPHYWHYLVNVLDETGLRQMYELSTRAWLRSYTYRGILRRPSFYSDFEEVVGKAKGHIICSSACIGGYLAQCILSGDKNNALKFINWNKKILGENNFFLEIQPCLETNEEQLKVNKAMWEFHKETNTPIIVTTDAHFKRPEDREIHTAFLKSKDGGDSREPEKFYQTTYLFTPKELREQLYVSGFDDEQIDEMFDTTNKIADRVQPIRLQKKVRVPQLPEIPKFKIKHTYKKYYDKFPFIKQYALSDNKQDAYYYYCLEKGLEKYSSNHNINIENYLERMNIEMEQVAGLSTIFGDCMANYFTVVQKVVDIIWNEGDSLVGIGRGSAGCWLTNFILGITGIDPMLEETKDFYNWWRFCSTARSDSIMDIDIDIQSFKKERIIQALKDYWGWRKVCQVATWGKLTSKTALEKAGKGLGIPDDSINYIKSLVPVKRGKIYSISDCLYGNKEKNREAVPAFKAEVEKYPNLLKTAQAFEGMIVSSGVHAGAVNLLRGDFTETGALMVSSSGAVCSQFDLSQAEYNGDLKFDLLSIDCLENIRSCLDLLLKNGKIQWQGSLRKTYNHYISYDVLEKDNKEMWSLLPEMVAAFQYDSRAGKEALKKVGAKNLVELALSNGLMRLSVPNGEQPMDKYVRYKADINEWYNDMAAYGLNKEEQNLYKEFLNKYNGLMISQETIMSTLMDKRVCAFTLKQADKARKAIASKSEALLEKTAVMLYEKGKECGRSQKFLDYLWKEQIEMSKSYAFNFAHAFSYSTECLQELNLYWKYGPVWWNTAVVTTQSQAMDERENVSIATDYGKIAQSIYKAKSNGIEVKPPYINQADLSFTPIEKDNSILFGLGAITSLSVEAANQIIENRPYTSLNDFCQKNLYTGSAVTNTRMITLIKAGCFDEFDKNRVRIMKNYIVYSTPKKNKLTMANVDEILRFKINLPRELRQSYNFKKYVCSKRFFVSNHPNFKSKKIYWLDEIALKYFKRDCQNNLKEGQDYWEQDGITVVVDKSLDKLFKEKMEKLKEYINTTEFLSEYNKAIYREKYNNLIGESNVNKWSFESVSYYSREHELANVNFNKYNLSKFGELPEEPVFIEKSWGKRTWKQFELYQICGVCLAKNDNNHLITLLTPEDNIINCKLNGPQYAHYKAQISETDETGKKNVKEKSWIRRGELLIVCGYRRGDSFVCKKYSKSIFKHCLQRITKVYPNGDLDIQMVRYGFEEDN